jgi:hypothetical protein
MFNLLMFFYVGDRKTSDCWHHVGFDRGFLYIVFTLNKILPFWQFGMLSGVAMVAFSALGYTEKQNHHLSGLL